MESAMAAGELPHCYVLRTTSPQGHVSQAIIIMRILGSNSSGIGGRFGITALVQQLHQ